MVFLSQSPRFLLGNYKHLSTVLDFWFAVEIYKIRRQVWIFISIFDCFDFIQPLLAAGKKSIG
jgi:hypothetical protein